MILYVRNSEWQNATQFYEVIYDETMTELTIKLNKFNEKSEEEVICSKTVNLNAMFKSNNYFTLRTKPMNGKTSFGDFIDMNSIARSRDELYMQSLIDNTSDFPNVVLYFNNSADEVIVIMNGPVKTDYAYKVIDNLSANAIAQEIYPDLVKTMNIWQARGQMIWDLDPNLSLAYIEAQLDAITKAFFLLLKQMPDSKTKLLTEFPELADFESELTSSTVFTVKSVAKCLEEIQDTKNKVRQLQKSYYEAKQENS